MVKVCYLSSFTLKTSVTATYDSPAHHFHHYSLEFHHICMSPECTALGQNI